MPSDPRKCNSRCKGIGLEKHEVGESTKRRAAMLEYSRDEVRAGEALQQIYDYFHIATEQLARAEMAGPFQFADDASRAPLLHTAATRRVDFAVHTQISSPQAHAR